MKIIKIKKAFWIIPVFGLAFLFFSAGTALADNCYTQPGSGICPNNYYYNATQGTTICGPDHQYWRCGIASNGLTNPYWNPIGGSCGYDTSWSPATSSYCSGQYFTQTSNCGNTRGAYGTKYCCSDSSWSPDTSAYCSGQYFTQTSNCGTQRGAYGTKDCNCYYGVHYCGGGVTGANGGQVCGSGGYVFTCNQGSWQWTGANCTKNCYSCSGTSCALQPLGNGSYAASNCNGACCTDSSWSPDRNTVCSGTGYTQTSNCGNTRAATGTKDCTCYGTHYCGGATSGVDGSQVCGAGGYVYQCSSGGYVNTGTTCSKLCYGCSGTSCAHYPLGGGTSSTSNCDGTCCTDSSWSPDPSTVCSGTSFTQTSNCGHTRYSTGTKDCSCSGGVTYCGGVTSGADGSQFCGAGGWVYRCNSGVYANSGVSCSKLCYYCSGTSCNLSFTGDGTSSSPNCDGACCTDSSWSPDPSTICSGTSFTQTSNCGHTRSATGTKDCTCYGTNYCGSAVSGAPGSQMCGIDGKKWQCNSGGYVSTGTACSQSEKNCYSCSTSGVCTWYPNAGGLYESSTCNNQCCACSAAEDATHCGTYTNSCGRSCSGTKTDCEYLSASATTVAYEGCATLTWTPASGAVTCQGYGPFGWGGEKSTSGGSQTVCGLNEGSNYFQFDCHDVMGNATSFGGVTVVNNPPCVPAYTYSCAVVSGQGICTKTNSCGGSIVVAQSECVVSGVPCSNTGPSNASACE